MEQKESKDLEGLSPLQNALKQRESKALDVVSVEDAKAKVSDVVVVGNGDMFQLLCKASSKSQGWMKSAKAMEIEGVGCVVQVTTQQGDNVAEALSFVPAVRVAPDVNGGRKLVSSFLMDEKEEASLIEEARSMIYVAVREGMTEGEKVHRIVMDSRFLPVIDRVVTASFDNRWKVQMKFENDPNLREERKKHLVIEAELLRMNP